MVHSLEREGEDIADEATGARDRGDGRKPSTRKGRPTRRALSLVREATRAILGRPAIEPRLIVLYGSEARGEATPESDIDLLVVLPGDEPNAVAAVRDAVYDVMWRHDFERLISVNVLSQSELDTLRRGGFSFIEDVEREGIVLWPKGG